NNPEASSAFAELFSALSLNRLKRGNIELADSYYSEMLRYRPDPNAANNAVREKIILSSDTDEARQFAMGRIIELQRHGGVPLSMRMKMFWTGHYGPSLHSILMKTAAGAAFILGVFFFVMLFRFMPRLMPKVSSFSKKPDSGDTTEPHSQVTGV